MSESTRIEATRNRCVFVDKYDDGVWLNVMSQEGTKNCVLTKEQAQKLIEALQSVISEEVGV